MAVGKQTPERLNIDQTIFNGKGQRGEFLNNGTYCGVCVSARARVCAFAVIFCILVVFLSLPRAPNNFFFQRSSPGAFVFVVC